MSRFKGGDIVSDKEYIWMVLEFIRVNRGDFVSTSEIYRFYSFTTGKIFTMPLSKDESFSNFRKIEICELWKELEDVYSR